MALLGAAAVAAVGCGSSGGLLPPWPEPAVRDAACAARHDCVVLERQEAGTDDAGRALTVVKTTGERPIATEASCEPFSYWLVVTEGGRLVGTQRLLDVCNDGYGAARVGEDEITVGANRFEHVQRGGSAWRWETRRVLRLSPLALVEEAGSGDWTVGDNREERTWSWTELRGRVTWFAPECALEDAAAAETRRGEEPGAAYEYLLIPRVELPPAFAVSGWQRLALGGCAVNVADGFALAGKGPAPKVLAVVSPRNELFLDGVPDGAAVELWVADAPSSYQNNCLPTPETPPVGWLLDLAASRARRLDGAPGSLVVARAAGRRKILLPEHTTALTIVLRDGARTFATSRLSPNKLATLGAVRDIAPTEAICVEQGGTLMPKSTRTFTRDRPAL
jgi:hypothetical protein